MEHDWGCWPDSPARGDPIWCKCKMPYLRWKWQYDSGVYPFCQGCGATDDTVSQRYKYVNDSLWCDYCWDLHALRMGPRGQAH